MFRAGGLVLALCLAPIPGWAGADAPSPAPFQFHRDASLTSGGVALAIAGAVTFGLSYVPSTAITVLALSNPGLLPLLPVSLPVVGPISSWIWFTLSGGLPANERAILPLLLLDEALQLTGLALILTAYLGFRQAPRVAVAPLERSRGAALRLSWNL